MIHLVNRKRMVRGRRTSPRACDVAAWIARPFAEMNASQVVVYKPPANFSFSVFRPRTTGTARRRSEEHTSELQSLMRISYAVFCLKKKTHNNNNKHYDKTQT